MFARSLAVLSPSLPREKKNRSSVRRVILTCSVQLNAQSIPWMCGRKKVLLCLGSSSRRKLQASRYKFEWSRFHIHSAWSTHNLLTASWLPTTNQAGRVWNFTISERASNSREKNIKIGGRKNMEAFPVWYEFGWSNMNVGCKKEEELKFLLPKEEVEERRKVIDSGNRRRRWWSDNIYLKKEIPIFFFSFPKFQRALSFHRLSAYINYRPSENSNSKLRRQVLLSPPLLLLHQPFLLS